MPASDYQNVKAPSADRPVARLHVFLDERAIDR